MKSDFPLIAVISLSLFPCRKMATNGKLIKVVGKQSFLFYSVAGAGLMEYNKRNRLLDSHSNSVTHGEQ